MARVAHIGAGSTGFGKRLTSEILAHRGLAHSTLSLMDISQDNLDIIAALTKKMAAQLGSTVKVEASTDRRKALEGADYVISTVENPGGSEAHIAVQRISDKYGVRQAVGCTSGLGGVFRALRFIPLMLDLCHDMEELCPGAWLLHYANPTSTMPWALNVASPVRSIGLCHSVQGTAAQLAGHIGAPYEETGHWAAGVNHQAWMLRFEWQGRDAYPLLFEKMQDPRGLPARYRAL